MKPNFVSATGISSLTLARSPFVDLARRARVVLQRSVAAAFAPCNSTWNGSSGQKTDAVPCRLPAPLRGFSHPPPPTDPPPVASAPSIKATGFQSAADDLMRLVESGRLSRAELEARLPASDSVYLGKTLAASSWVPIEVYVRVGDILVELEGGGDARAYFRARGRRAAERLHRAGLYKQFDASVETWGKRAGNIATTMSGVLYNFGRWTFETKPGREPFTITVEDAAALPEYLRFVGEGFIEYTSSHMSEGREAEVISKRVTPDRIVYTVTVD
jgi:hypothetical protein